MIENEPAASQLGLFLAPSPDLGVNYEPVEGGGIAHMFQPPIHEHSHLILNLLKCIVDDFLGNFFGWERLFLDGLLLIELDLAMEGF